MRLSIATCCLAIGLAFQAPSARADLEVVVFVQAGEIGSPRKFLRKILSHLEF